MDCRIALAGNPNSGKTTLFNVMTGSFAHVGNWPGVTVERREGKIKHLNYNATLVDLPGIYSLSPYSPEEVIARDYIMKEKPDLVINIVDASNLERNLYLTLQLLETGVPVIVALNMMDVLRKNGDKLNIKNISEALKVPVVKISASKSEGIDELREKIKQFLESRDNIRISGNKAGIYAHNDIKSAIDEIAALLHGISDRNQRRWTAIKILEDDDLVKKEIQLDKKGKEKILSITKFLKNKYNMDVALLLADARYKYIEKIVQNSVIKNEKSQRESLSDKIDKILTNRLLAIPIFLAVMLAVFQITFGWVGETLTFLLNKYILEPSVSAVKNFMIQSQSPAWLVSLFSGGIMAGVVAVLSFLPQIMLMYFFLGLLEDSGYMARAAFIMDRLLRKIGLSGKAFVPMLMGFGCSVPAIMAARTLENEKDRKITIMLVPFMSCGAKMPVYAVFIGAFFEKNRGIIIFSIYLLGILMAILSGCIIKLFVYRGKTSPFVMELPPYRFPTFKSLLRRIRQQVTHFLKRAGTALLGASVVIWFLQYFDFSLNMVSDNSKSILADLGRLIAPIFKPLGFGKWESSVALLTGLIAKESVVSTLSVLYSQGGPNIVSSLRNVFTPLTAYSFMVFVLLYVPCVAALTTAKKELNSFRRVLTVFIYQMFVAWMASFVIFQTGKILGFE